MHKQASSIRGSHSAMMILIVAALGACNPDGPTLGAATVPATSTARGPVAAPAPVHPLVAAARGQIGVTTEYDAAYRALTYPNGDVPLKTGVCADVIVRAMRAQNLDLQKLVHEDMAAHFAAYPRNWSLTAPDKNIDHRRVLNLMTYFSRQGAALPNTQRVGDYAPGDIVGWDLSGRGLTHIGIVSDKKSPAGTPLIIHNIGSGAQESDILLSYTIIGHYRLAMAAR